MKSSDPQTTLLRRLSAHARLIWAMALLILGCLSASSLAWAQATTSVRGTVTDPSGSVVPKASVVLTNTASKTERTAETGVQGEYQFLFLPPGTYTLAVTAAGFERYEQKGLELLVNTPATANIPLKIGQATQSVTVTGEAAALNMVDASLGNSFNEVQVKQIPLEGRNVPDLLSLQAGVAYTGNRPDIDKDQDTRNGAVNGARSDQSNISLDGVDVNDQSNGYAFTSVLPVTLDSVEEFRVTTTNYNADQGEGSGAQVALVTKSGTNRFHGSAYEYHRNTITSANDFFVKRAEQRVGQPNVPDKLLRNIFGVSLGGPIHKDRLFFFVNYEGTRQREEESTVRTIPTPTLCQGMITYQNVAGSATPTTTLMPSDIRALDPQPGVGINPAVLDLVNHTGYFDKTFCTGKFNTNDSSVGDGFNYSGFRFRAPVRLDNNAFIAKIDYKLTADGKHTIFWRGAMQNLYNPQAPFLPGSPPEQTLSDHSKGFALGYTAVLTSTLANTFHWGLTRQSTGVIGDTNQPWNLFYGLDQGVVYTHNQQVPVHNLLDDLSWTKGKHTLQMGGNFGWARNPRVSFQHSFSVGKGATNWMSPTGFANTGGGSPLDPANRGFAEPASSPAYDYPMLALLGMVSDVVGNYNYDKQGNVLAAGTPVKLKYGLDWYEFYGQDSWRIKPNLTVTYGLRWSLFPPPWEVNGFQASPTVDLGKQFDQIVKNQKLGMGYDSVPLVAFELGGSANNGPDFYRYEKSDFSPRVSVAYSARFQSGWLRQIFGEGDKTVIRGGFSKVYDRAGMQLLNTFDANPPGGLGATIQNPCCSPTYFPPFAGASGVPGSAYDNALGVPRITNINIIPTVNQFGDIFFEPAPPALHPPPFNQAITWGVDQSLKTPHAYAFDFSIARELPKRFSIQFAYVGRLGRKLLTQRDLRQPLDIVDPKTGVDYNAAATALSKLARTGVPASQVTAALVGPTASYWTDMLPPIQPGATNYTSFSGFASPNLIQVVYDLYFNPSVNYVGNEVVGIGNIDLYSGLGDNLANVYTFCATPPCTGLGGGAGDFLNNQATSMFAWSSVGSSSYNALQINLRKQAGNGVQFDLNYTYSRSIDITSAASRLGWSSSINVGAPGSRLVNAFSPNQRRGVSDFDTTHQINLNWIADLPFGRGKSFGHDANRGLDAVIGGWQVSGLARWTSGLPFTVDNGNFWPTNWDEQGIAQLIAPVKTGHFQQPGGAVSAFPNPAVAFNSFQHPFPGASGSRNVVRGDGFAGLDMALSKRWKLPAENHSLQFRWEVFNVPNLKRFNALSGLGTQACACIASLQQVPSSFGNYTGLLTQPRVMQFALRYDF